MLLRMDAQTPRIVYVADGSCQALTLDQAIDVEYILSRGPRHNNLPYGWRVAPGHNRGRIPVRSEQETLGMIRRLRAQGWGRIRIAKRLDALGIRPRKGGARWDTTSVQGILDRIDREQRAHRD